MLVLSDFFSMLIDEAVIIEVVDVVAVEVEEKLLVKNDDFGGLVSHLLVF